MLDVKYEDEYLMVVNKPRGMVSCKGVGTNGDTLEDITGGYLVHRLDKNTAGLLIVAKDAHSQEVLQEMLQAREIKRTYKGLVEGVLHGTGTIDKNIVRSPRHRTLYIVTDNEHGRKAVTHWAVERNFRGQTLVKFVLDTGRTHQIRVHCKSIGRPIVGDPEYNSGGKLARGIGQMLESVAISFVHPFKPTTIDIEIPTTELFNSVIKKCVPVI